MSSDGFWRLRIAPELLPRARAPQAFLGLKPTSRRASSRFFSSHVFSSHFFSGLPSTQRRYPGELGGVRLRLSHLDAAGLCAQRGARALARIEHRQLWPSRRVARRRGGRGALRAEAQVRCLPIASQPFRFLLIALPMAEPQAAALRGRLGGGRRAVCAIALGQAAGQEARPLRPARPPAPPLGPPDAVI